jgi:two-component system chemotaxis response regulator CheY
VKVFIVEDNSLTRFTVKTAIEKLGHEFIGEAGSFKEAMDKLSVANPEVLLLDIILPDKNGLEVLKEFRKMNKTTKVIIITALEEEGLNQELLKEGANHILKKPFSIDELDSALKKI